jgi:hypothetical protein
LINALGGLAKGWNYEAEQLIRTSSVDYTIIRPGVMMDQLPPDDKKESDVIDSSTTNGETGQTQSKGLALRDDGGDLKVLPVSYRQIADLAIDCAFRDNCQRATITAMNSSGQDATADWQTLEQVNPDRRTFPTSLIEEHKKAARVGGLSILIISGLVVQFISSLLLRLVLMVLPASST